MKRAIMIGLAGWLSCAGSPADPEATVAEPEAIERAPTGDRIVLRSGKTIQGIRVLRESVVDVKVEVLPGLPPLVLPAGQVVGIRYEKAEQHDSNPDASPSTEASPAADPELIPASKADPEFSRQLAAEVTDETIEFERRDAVWILETVSEKMQVPLVISKRLRDRPVAHRRCSLRIEKGQSLHTFLQVTILEAAPWMKIQYDFNTLRASLRSE